MENWLKRIKEDVQEVKETKNVQAQIRLLKIISVNYGIQKLNELILTEIEVVKFLRSACGSSLYARIEMMRGIMNMTTEEYFILYSKDNDYKLGLPNEQVVHLFIRYVEHFIELNCDNEDLLDNEDLSEQELVDKYEEELIKRIEK